MLRGSGTFGDDGHYLSSGLKQLQELACSSQTESLPITKQIDLNFEFNYKIEVTPKIDDEVQAISEDIVDFEHLFEISNEGVSPTNKDKRFYLDVPNVVVKGDPAFTDEHQAECQFLKTMPVKTTNAEKLSQITCDTFDCNRYNCSIKQGLDKNNKNNLVGVILRMKADPKLLNTSGLLAEKFDILTKFTMDGEQKKIFESKSTFEKNIVGALEALTEWWPILVGVGIGALLVGLCIYGFIKSGLFQKLRFYDEPNNEEEKNEVEENEK